MKKISKKCENGIKAEEHINLVHACCQRFRNRGIDYDDVFQSGCVGLVKATKKFDASKGLKFSTYAVPVILGEIKTLFQNNVSIKVSRKIKELAIKIKYEREKIVNSMSREPTVNELSQILDVSSEQVLEALEICKFPISLDAKSNDENDNHPPIEISVDFEDERINNKISIAHAVKDFDERDKKLIYLRFFRCKTQSETAKNLGMTQVQVSRREKVLLKSLKEKLA